MFQPNYKRTYEDTYRDHRIEVVHYVPDFAVDIDGGFFGFFRDTASAAAAARNHIDTLIREQEKRQCH